jgi:hypothetical protein
MWWPSARALAWCCGCQPIIALRTRAIDFAVGLRQAEDQLGITNGLGALRALILRIESSRAGERCLEAGPRLLLCGHDRLRRRLMAKLRTDRLSGARMGERRRRGTAQRALKSRNIPGAGAGVSRGHATKKRSRGGA